MKHIIFVYISQFWIITLKKMNKAIKILKEDYNESNRLIFINAWNNYFEGSYLEPDERYGYASINALSKSLFGLSFRNSNYNLSYLMNNCLVAVQAHIFYEDIINEITNKTNNIPIKFDLYITTDTKPKMKFIKNYIDKYSKANIVTIKIIENKGRDILPFLIQMGEVIGKYKYLCHLHSKKSPHVPELGEKWRTYLFYNLLGTTEIISEILSDFEMNDKLGLIFPENYYKILEFTMFIDDEDQALRMKDEGWNVQILEARPDHPDDNTKYFINATIKFCDRYGNPLRYQPKVYIINNGKPTQIGEKALGSLDEKQIKYIDVVLNPSVKDDGTFKAYVNELYVVVEESRLHDKYAINEYPEDDLSPEDDPFGM